MPRVVTTVDLHLHCSLDEGQGDFVLGRRRERVEMELEKREKIERQVMFVFIRTLWIERMRKDLQIYYHLLLLIRHH